MCSNLLFPIGVALSSARRLEIVFPALHANVEAHESRNAEQGNGDKAKRPPTPKEGEGPREQGHHGLAPQVKAGDVVFDPRLNHVAVVHPRIDGAAERRDPKQVVLSKAHRVDDRD